MKLLLKVFFIALTFINVSAVSDEVDNQTTSQEIQAEFFTECNDQLILSDVSDKQPVQNKKLFDLSIKEVWNTKLKPFLTSNKFNLLCLSIFSVIQINRLSDIFDKMCHEGRVLERYRLRHSFDLNAIFLLFPSVCLIFGIMSSL